VLICLGLRQAPICVYALWQAVGQSGGYTAVSSCKLWAAAARMFGASETLTCGGHTMRQNYINSGLHALELAIKGGDVVEGVTLPEESEDAPLVKRAGVPGRRRLRESDEYPSSATGIPGRGPTNRAPTQMSILALVRKSTTNDDGAEGSTEPTVAEFDELLMGDPESVPRVGDAVDVRALSKGLRGAWVPGRVVDVAQGSQWEGGFRFLVAPLPVSTPTISFPSSLPYSGRGNIVDSYSMCCNVRLPFVNTRHPLWPLRAIDSSMTPPTCTRSTSHWASKASGYVFLI
jgi:hypothetical protein